MAVLKKIKKAAGYITAISSTVAAIGFAIYAFGSPRLEPASTEPKVAVSIENKIFINGSRVDADSSRNNAGESLAGLECRAENRVEDRAEKPEGDGKKQCLTIFEVSCSKGTYKVPVDFLMDSENQKCAYLWLETMLAGCKGRGFSDKTINGLLKCVDNNQNQVLELHEIKDFETRIYRERFYAKK